MPDELQVFPQWGLLIQKPQDQLGFGAAKNPRKNATALGVVVVENVQQQQIIKPKFSIELKGLGGFIF